jgi:hypothetical protein
MLPIISFDDGDSDRFVDSVMSFVGYDYGLGKKSTEEDFEEGGDVDEDLGV